MKLKLLGFAALAVGLSACQTVQQTEKIMGAGFAKLQYQPVQKSTAVLGFPSSERVVAGEKIITWQDGWDENYTLPTVNTSTGFVAGRPITMTSYGTQNSTVAFSCKIEAKVDKAGIVRAFEYDGDVKGCEKYTKRMKAIVPEG